MVRQGGATTTGWTMFIRVPPQVVLAALELYISTKSQVSMQSFFSPHENKGTSGLLIGVQKTLSWW